MKNMFLSLLVLLSFVKTGQSSLANADGMLQSFGSAQGLSGTQVSCVLQDNRGFLWIGTANGLNRYDGYHFRVFREKTDASGLSHPFVMSLYEDRDGMLWVGTLDGLNTFDRTTQSFRRYQLPSEDGQPPFFNSEGGRPPFFAVSSLVEDRQGNLWLAIAKWGLVKFERERETFTRYAHDPENPNSPVSNKIYALLVDRQGRIWIGTEDRGLSRFDPDTGLFTSYLHGPENPPDRNGKGITCLYEDSEGVLWAGTETHGLYRYEPALDSFRSISAVREITAIGEEADGRVWLGSTQGVLRFHKNADGGLLPQAGGDDSLEPLRAMTISSLHQDRSGVMWIGTLEHGLFKYRSTGTQDVERYQLRPDIPDDPDYSLEINAIFEDETGLVWLGFERGGLMTLDRRNGQAVSFPVEPDNPQKFGAADVYGIYEDRDGTFWFGTTTGLYALDRSTGVFTRYTHNPDDPGSLSHNTVSTICQDASGALWLGTLGGGVNRLDLERRRFTHYTYDPQAPGDSISHDEAWVRCSSQSERIWIGTFGGGLNEIELKPEGKPPRIRHHQFPGLGNFTRNIVIAIHEDAHVLWLGTLNGLLKYEPETGESTHYGSEHGLPSYGVIWPSSAVFGILPDAKGRLWVSCSSGIAVFDPETETFTPSTIGQGQEFNLGASYTNSKGELFFASGCTLYIFQPGRQQKNAIPPQIELTGLQKGGEPIETVGMHEILLNWRQNFFEFEFAALHFIQPENNQYAYRLEGFDESWNYSGTRRFGRYTNLPGGRYVLHLKGANSDGLWNEEGRRLMVLVETPPWKRWWAYLVYVCGPAILLLAYIHHMNTRRQLEEAIRLIVEGTASAIGSAFFRSLAENLASVLGVKFLLVSECLDSPQSQAKTLAFWTGNDFAENFEYDLNDDVTGSAGEQRIVFYRHGVQKQFPNDELIAVTEAESYAQISLLDSSGGIIGFIQVLHDRPLSRRTLMFSVLKIFGARAEGELERQQAERRLKRSLEEKNALLKEVHHRVKNNLQVISGLLGMQARQIQRPELLSIFQQSQDRIKSMALIHEKLYRSENLSAIDMAQYLNELGIYLFSAYGVNSQRIALDTRIDAISFPFDTAVPCAMIVSELVTNALKHAFPKGRRGKIRILLERNGENQRYRLSVSDNGKGFQDEEAGEAKASLGLKLVELFSGQLDGQLSINRQCGTQVSISFSI